MDTFLGLTSTGWTGIYTILTAGLLLVAIVAAGYAKRQWDTAKSMAAETTRPYVTVTLEPSGASPRLIDLVVRNIGSRPAYDVELTFAPPLVAARATPQFDPARAKMLTQPIALLAPGQAMSIFFDNHLDRAERDDLPLSHQAKALYRDRDGQWFTDEYTLDFDAHRGGSFVGVRTLHDIGQELEAIRRVLERASVLASTGQLEVEAAVEPRIDKLDRMRQEHQAQLDAIERLDALRASQRAAQPVETAADDVEPTRSADDPTAEHPADSDPHQGR